MNRIIKFRFWENSSKTMIDWLCVRQTAFNRGDMRLMYDMMGTNPDIIKMQFTGLLDKNGKEIYEGDLLSPFHESIGPYWVVFENGSYVCYHKHGRWGLLSRAFEADILKDYSPVVIGNIYENPELLKP